MIACAGLRSSRLSSGSEASKDEAVFGEDLKRVAKAKLQNRERDASEKR
jgi:hypothetical protein